MARTNRQVWASSFSCASSTPFFFFFFYCSHAHLHGPHHKNNANDEKDAQWHEPTGRPGLHLSRALLQRPSSSSSFAHTHTCTGHTIRTMRTMRRMRHGTNQQAGLGFVFLVRFFNRQNGRLRIVSTRSRRVRFGLEFGVRC